MDPAVLRDDDAVVKRSQGTAAAQVGRRQPGASFFDGNETTDRLRGAVGAEVRFFLGAAQHEVERLSSDGRDAALEGDKKERQEGANFEGEDGRRVDDRAHVSASVVSRLQRNQGVGSLLQ